jgi:GT2 family glycosyltransferase
VPELTVVIPTLNRSATLPRALAALSASAKGREVEAIVASDALDADPAAAAAALGACDMPGRHVIADRPGASAARNAGVAAGSSPVVLFLDDDVLPGPDLVAEHLDWHGRMPEPEIGVLGKLVWARELRVTPFMRWLEQGFHFDYGSIAGEQAGWGHFYTANVSIKREMLDRVGGFDAVVFPFHYEDLDLGLRMSREGFDLRYNDRALAEHLHAPDLDSWRERLRAVAVAERRFCETHPEAVPYLYERFAEAAEHAPARGRSAKLARLIGPGFPLAGPRLWAIVDLYYRQQAAPVFMEAWATAEAGPGA